MPALFAPCRFAAVLGPLILFAFVASAQITTADIVGRVADSSGAALTTAKLVLISLDTNIERATQANESGDYIFNLLPPGRYSLRVEASGFKTFHVTEITIAAGDRARIDASMQVGGTSESITVTGEIPALQTDSSTVGTAVTGRLVQDLPLNGRNYIQLAQLAPGVSQGPPNGLATGTRPDDRKRPSKHTLIIGASCSEVEE